MKSFLLLVIVLLVFSCTGEEFSPDKWTGGDNELIVELSESTISLRDYKTCVDTIFISTNGTDWDFQVDSSATWCRCAKIDSMLLFFIDENRTTLPRMAVISVTGYYNHLKQVEKVSVVQPALHFSNSGFVATEPFITFSYNREWNNYVDSISWSFSESIRSAILSELGLQGVVKDDITDLVKQRVIVINSFKSDGTYTDNVLNDHTSATGYWFKKDGRISNYGDGVLCCEFGNDDLGNIEYDKGSISLHPLNVKNEDAQYCAYYIFSYGEKHVVLKWILNISAAKEWQVVKDYNLQSSVMANLYASNAGDTFQYKFLSMCDSIAEIEELIGGEINTIQVFRPGDMMLPLDDPLHYSGYIDYDRVTLHFGEEGLVRGPAYCTILLTKEGEVLVSMISVFEDLYNSKYPSCFKSKWLMGNKLTGKAVEVSIDISLKDHRAKQYRIDVTIPPRPGVEGYDVYNDNLYDYFNEFDKTLIEIESWLGKPVNVIYMGKHEESMDSYVFYNGAYHDYWFGDDGMENWGTEEVLFHLNPINCAAYKYHEMDRYPASAQCIYHIINTETFEVVEIILNVDIE